VLPQLGLSFYNSKAFDKPARKRMVPIPGPAELRQKGLARIGSVARRADLFDIFAASLWSWSGTPITVWFE
jgi:hypothetical protein